MPDHVPTDGDYELKWGPRARQGQVGLQKFLALLRGENTPAPRLGAQGGADQAGNVQT